jgi:hypothetical protein
MTLRLRWLTPVLLAGGLLAVLAVWTPAQDKKDEAKPADEKPAEPDPVLELSTTAYKTADFGRENKSPEALVAAAVMLRSLKAAKKEPITEQPTDENGKAVEEKSLADKSFAEEADDLFAEASLMAAELKIDHFDAVIDGAKKRNTRGLVGGARTIRRRIGPGKTETFHFKFQSDKPAPFAFHATHPLHLHAVRTDYDHTWVNGIYQQYVNASPDRVGGKRGQHAPVTFKIHNPHRHAAEYVLFLK